MTPHVTPAAALPALQNDPSESEDVLFHVFLPSTFTPNTKHPTEINPVLLPLMTTVLSKVLPNESKTWQSFQLWEAHQPNLDPTPTAATIDSLDVGQTLPICVFEQNAAILITQQENDRLTFSTFRLSLPSEKVMSNCSTFASSYPTNTVTTPKSKLLTSKALVRQLADLNEVDMRESVATVKKANMNVIEKRDVSDPIYISKWLLSVISNRDSRASEYSEFPHVFKKVRDSVRIKEGIVHRRSGMWTCVKVTLHLLLLKEYGLEVGTFLYKIILIQFMVHLIKNRLETENITLLEYLAKIARRVFKLDKLYKRQEYPPWIMDLYNETLQLTANSCHAHHDRLKKASAKFIEESKKEAKFDLSDIKLWLKQTLKFNHFSSLFNAGSTFERVTKVSKLQAPIQVHGIRHRDNRELFNYAFLDGILVNKTLTMYDFERNVGYWQHSIGSADGRYVWEGFLKYYKLGKEFYKYDCVGYSRFILTLLKIIRLWEEVVCERYPLLLEHRAGVDLTVGKDLLLTNRMDLVALAKIETYFLRRDKKATFPSLIEEVSPTMESFSHRFVDNLGSGQKFRDVRNYILNWGQKQVEKKLVEVGEARRKCQILEGKARQIECEYVVDNWKRKHVPSCQKCQLITQERNMRVGIFESPLPVGVNVQNSVVFELMIPEQIGVLRDLLHIFNQEITGNMNTTELYGPWHDYAQIRTCCIRDKAFYVSLWSEKKTFQETHYSKLHPSNPDADFIKVNGYNCVYASQFFDHPTDARSGQLVTMRGPGLKAKTTLRVEKRSKYSFMQGGINGDLTQNEAIARQNECHPDLSLTEFVEFQSLRSVKNLQFRALFRCINAGTLSLKEESVFNLVCQVMWNVGDRTNNEYLRSNQLDFSCNEFCEEFLDLLDKLRAKHDQNWKDHYVVLTIIYLTQTICQLNPAVERKGFKLLGNCRKDTVRWSAEIQRILSSLTSAPRKEVDSLRIKLIEVNCCIALTFRVDEIFLYEIIADGTFIEWLLAVARIHDNLVLLGDSEYKLKFSLKNMVSRIEELGVDLEPFLQEGVRCSDLLTSFVEKHHSGSCVWKMREKQNMRWNMLQDGQVYYCEIHPVDGFGEVSRIQMDLIKGQFLVDGCPVGYLPVTIEKHRDFQRAFGEGKSFEVEAFAFQPGRMITKDKFLGSNYSFYLTDSKLTIIEHRENDIQLELIDDGRFQKNIPDLLIENYTHWFNYKAGQFEFFKKDFKLATPHPEYILEYKQKERGVYLYCVKDEKKVVIDVNCPDYSTILNVVERLEQRRFTIVWCQMNESSFVYTVDMPRMGLTFSVRNVGVVLEETTRGRRVFTNSNRNSGAQSTSGGKRRLGDLVSKEYRGMRVSTNQQSLETLIGLRNGLFLEDADVNSNAKMNSILLVPHARPYVRNKQVFIDTTDIRTPAFFAYEVDTRLKQLKAGDSRAGWLYLAYLHALTNSHYGMQDPFTGVTGYERAMQILQSGLCFSSEPLDEESLKTMKMFMKLCPVRVFYPPNTRCHEQIDNKQELPLRCVGDAYYLVIDQLIDDSQRLAFLYPEWKGYDEDIEDRGYWEEDLNWKAYWNKHYYSNEASRIKGVFLPEEPSTEPFTEFLSVDETVQSTSELAQALHTWTASKTSTDPKTLLKCLLMSGRDLKGILKEETFPIKEGVYIWARVDFRDYWLDLYNLARKIKKRDLKSEWTFLLTYFNFRKDFTTVDQLKLLQLIAVNWEEFEKLDPPDYEGYTNTSEVTFDKEEVRKTLLRYKKSWESYLDRNIQEMKEWENELDFAERMKPTQLDLVNLQIESISNLIEKQWPIDNLEWLQVEYEDRTEIDLDSALTELGLMIKSWFRNKELNEFLEIVAATVESLKVQAKIKMPDFKKIFRQHRRDHLETFCYRPRVTIDFASLSSIKEFKQGEQSKIELARQIFHVTNHSPKMAKLLSTDNDVPDFPLELANDDPILCDYMQDLKTSWGLHHRELKRSKSLAKNKLSYKDQWEFLAREQRKHKMVWEEFWELCKQKFIPYGPIGSKPMVDQILLSAELFPRIVPLTMLKMLLETPTTSFETDLRDLIGAYAVEMTFEQKFSRCIRYAKSNKDLTDLELQQELANNGHENWNPSERPDWLLFEIESDLLIRPVQATVADRMIKPPKGENSVIQLNMGEGKTWVIVPLLALSLANGNDLCRITVLKSLFQINKTYLSFKIGSQLLDRRIYCFPSRRDFKIGVPQSKAMMDIYEECLDLKGIVLTLPEYRLSADLKAFERFHAGAFEDGMGLFRLQKWIKENVRDVLDESDEILHCKYQLIYTLGKQLPVTGGTIRWTVIQDILSVLPQELSLLHEKMGPGFVEFKERMKENAYPFCRILKVECAGELISSLAKRIISGKTPIQIPRLPQKLFTPLFDFFTKEELSRDGLNLILKSFSESIQELFLVIRGYLACGVLVNCLTKRWRVNYGVAKVPTHYYRRMAVPFRAKDVASDRIEFGHPDVAILLSQLSYYYSGLTDEQMEHCFGALLHLEPNPPLEYSKWVSLISEEKFPNKSKIRTLSSINFNDFFQKTEIVFPLLRYNRNLINFYLSKAVFPQESKQFGWKIGCSPWDLCNTFTTGFSGTNDSKILLPSTIRQRDLNELKGTNGGVLASLLLQSENYEVLAKATAISLLKKLVEANIRILLDVGALMLELDNEQVSRKWLELLHDANVSVDAAVFFDTNDKLMVLDRMNNIIPFELSTFRSRLDRCCIYLDDAHTRGTDLKIPKGNTAVVTLGKGVGKDKLVQGCMRMRKLGKGHNVVFWASSEVDESIKSFHGNGQITAKEVLLWAIKNNQQQIRDGFVHWSSAGVYMAQKLSSLQIFENTLQLNTDLVVLSESCSQKEQIDLKAMYGDTRQIVEFPVIVDHLLKRVKRELAKVLTRKSSLKLDCSSIVEEYGQCVVDHVQKYVPNMMRSNQLLEEEQERELELELEAQCQKQLPLRARAMEHSTCVEVQNFILSGSLHEIEKWTLKLPLALQNTSVWKFCSSDRWGKHIYCSKDFVSVVKTDKKISDDYLRPVEFFASVKFDDKTVLLLLSNYEAGSYLDLFRSCSTKATLHMHSALIGDAQQSLHDRVKLSLPKRVVGFDRSLNPALTLFSGGFHFNGEDEQNDYAYYLGYVTGDVPDEILEENGVVCGWVKKEFWGKLGTGAGVEVAMIFDECPELMVKEILRLRWGVRKIGRDCGVGKVVGG